MFFVVLAFSLIISYLLGSIPFGYITGKLFGRVDVRNYGSGKIGATNVVRTVGVKAGLLVFIMDMAKGAGAVFLSGWIMSRFTDISGNPSLLLNLSQAACGVAAISGHNWPIFLKFRGGRGVMPTMGVFLVLSPVAAAGATLVAFLAIAIWRFVSLGSMVGALSLVLIIAFLSLSRNFPPEILIFAIFSCMLIIFQHKDNIYRLVKGTERKLGQKAENL